ncbi:predicted protein [Nematostella vectensis]|uniref:G-protein coupled receptors family 1 profile domain-containing protein n=1 Tax=Nematostella vectensis TaxID=45351 RepID=A7S6F4_NEMVE|nr:adenosine receptor A1-like [Nematostella vectensis]EDO40739.1 predicted protein [Nematostella vectensis]|eukprot:XP_001632802.1 predicted protein [Nematostella vectensis]
MAGHGLGVIIPLSILAVAIVILNIAVCVFVCINKALRTHTNGFIVSLAISDVLVGGILFPLYMCNPTAEATGYLVSVILLSGVANLLAVTYDRYIAIVTPLGYLYKISKYFKRIVFTSWALPIAYSLLPLIWRTNIYSKEHKVYLLILQLFGVVVPFLLIVFAYCRIFYTVRKSLKLRKRLPLTTMNNTRGEQRRVSTDARVAKVFAVVSVTFLLSWLPVIYITTADLIGRPDLIPLVLADISFFTIALSSLLDPLVYSFLKPDFRRAILAIWRGRSEQQSERVGCHSEVVTMTPLRRL